MKTFLALIFVAISIYADEAEQFFNASKDNFLLCRAGYETYVMLSAANASIETINGTKYIRYKQKDYYFPLAGCNPVTEHKQGIIF